MSYVDFGRKNTRAEALASTNKDKIFFPTDSETIVLGGKEYGGGRVVNIADYIFFDNTTSKGMALPELAGAALAYNANPIEHFRMYVAKEANFVIFCANVHEQARKNFFLFKQDNSKFLYFVSAFYNGETLTMEIVTTKTGTIRITESNAVGYTGFSLADLTEIVTTGVNELGEGLWKKVDKASADVTALDIKVGELGYEENFVMGNDVYLGEAEIGDDGESLVMPTAEYDEENEAITIK